MNYTIRGTAPVRRGRIQLELDEATTFPVNRIADGLPNLARGINDAQPRRASFFIPMNPDAKGLRLAGDGVRLVAFRQEAEELPAVVRAVFDLETAVSGDPDSGVLDAANDCSEPTLASPSTMIRLVASALSGAAT